MSYYLFNFKIYFIIFIILEKLEINFSGTFDITIIREISIIKLLYFV